MTDPTPDLPTQEEQVKYLRTIDIPATARQVLYGVASGGSLVLAYLGAESILDGPALAMGFGATSLVFALATGKTDTTRPVAPKPAPVVVAPAVPDPAPEVPAA